MHSENHNLSVPEKELLCWHYCLGHLGFCRIQHLLHTGVLSHHASTCHLHTTACKINPPPCCAACLFGKQTCCPSPGTTTSIICDRAGVLKAENLLAGQQVSVDHFVCSTKGRLFTSRGKTSDTSMYDGGCIFVDHASNFVHIEFQAQLNTHETLRAKQSYEAFCRDHGVIPQSYLSDNGSSFTSSDFHEHLS